MTRHMTISADWKDLGDEAETPDLHMNWEEGMEEGRTGMWKSCKKPSMAVGM